MVDLSIIILSYNTKRLLRECLLSIRKHRPQNLTFEVIVIDNASSDGTAKEIENLIRQYGGENLKSIINKKNLGFSKANNIAVRQTNGRYILFLNADTLVYPRTLETMVHFMERHEKVGAATCRIELPDGRLDDSCHRGFPTPWRAFCHFSGLSRFFPKSSWFSGYNLGSLDLATIHEIDSCSGAFMIVRREAGEEIACLPASRGEPARQDWWDEDFFWYGDDLDFCYRLKEKGWKIYFVPTVKILHYKGVSGGIKKISQHLTRATKETRIQATKARFKAMETFYNKHYKNKYSKIVTSLVMVGISLKRWLALRSLS